MTFRGIDVARLWRERRWVSLLNLIDHLPQASFYVEAIADDEELAHSENGDVRPRPPRVSEFDPRLAEIIDRLRELIVVVARVNGGEAKFRPSPRPVTAADRARARRRRDAHDALVARVLPKGGGSDGV